MKVELYYKVNLFDTKTGRIIRKGRRRKADSFVLAFMDLLYTERTYKENVSIVDSGGVSRDVDAASGNLRTDTPSGAAYLGIIVGTGNTAVALADYNLDSQIGEGTGSGQMEHGASTNVAPTFSGSSGYFRHHRTIVNNSGATITIAEIGMLTRGLVQAAYNFFLIIRDVLGSPVAVADGQGVTITYEIKVTVA